MSIDHSVCLMVGKEFTTTTELVEFCKKNNILSKGDIKQLEDNGDSYIVELRPSDFHVRCLNFYTGEGFAIGYDIDVGNSKEMIFSIKENALYWYEALPDVEHDIICTVTYS